jgi:hypothetical protein
MHLKEIWRVCAGFMWFRVRTSDGSCKHGSGPSGSVKGGGGGIERYVMVKIEIGTQCDPDICPATE